MTQDIPFLLESDYGPGGDQPQAIQELVQGVEEQKKHQVLLGITGSGKTFTMANVIRELQRPSLVIAHNKTLAAQLFNEFKSFFPHNAVEYFVSYYDYYQPEAYVPHKDLYIEKDTSLNDELDRLRLSATRSMLERRDVIIVSSRMRPVKVFYQFEKGVILRVWSKVLNEFNFETSTKKALQALCRMIKQRSVVNKKNRSRRTKVASCNGFQ